jgi:preprotein translocase subunit YajC
LRRHSAEAELISYKEDVLTRSYYMIVIVVVFFAVFYFFAIRPQSKQRKAHQEMMNSLAKGDTVMTASGIYGKVVKVDDSLVVIEIAKGVTMKVVRRAIADIIRDKERAKALAPEGATAKGSRAGQTSSVQETETVDSAEGDDNGEES